MLLTGTCKANHVKHMAVLLESLQYGTFDSLVFFLLGSFRNNSPAFYHFWVYLGGLREARAAKSSTGKGVPLIKICRKEQAEVMRPPSKTYAVGNALRTKIHSTLPNIEVVRIRSASWFKSREGETNWLILI